MSLGMGKENTKRWITMFIVWLIVMLMALLASGCSSEYSGDFNRVTYSWAVQTLDDSNDPWDELMGNDPHKDCRNKHHIDPYTKLEYCLPEDLTTIRNMNAFRVQK